MEPLEPLRIRLRRVYEAALDDEGLRVLVDRVWPRGLSRERVGADHWWKDAGPSAELRRWFGHERERWPEFKERYFRELDALPEVVARLLEVASSGPLTLLYSARDTEYNQAVALAEYLSDSRRPRRPAPAPGPCSQGASAPAVVAGDAGEPNR